MAIPPKRLPIAAALLACALSPTAQAVSFVALPGTSIAAQPHLAGTVVDQMTTPFRLPATAASGETEVNFIVTGTVTSQVVRAVDGTFDFYWQIKPDAEYSSQTTNQGIIFPVTRETSPSLPVSDFHVTSFTASLVRPDWRSDGPGNAAPRTAAVLSDGIHYRFGEFFGEDQFYRDSTLQTGGTSYLLLADTDAPGYTRAGQFSLSTQEDLFAAGSIPLVGRSDSYVTFAPIPEPQTWALMLIGLGCVAGVARRRAQRKLASMSSTIASSA